MRIQIETPIVLKVYDFYKEFYSVIEKMPKKDKYTLGEKLQTTILDFWELLISAGYLSKEEKINVLQKASAKLDLLKLLIRVSGDIKAVQNKKYILLEEKLTEIGRMLGGWIRSLK